MQNVAHTQFTLFTHYDHEIVLYYRQQACVLPSVPLYPLFLLFFYMDRVV